MFRLIDKSGQGYICETEIMNFMKNVKYEINESQAHYFIHFRNN